MHRHSAWNSDRASHRFFGVVLRGSSCFLLLYIIAISAEGSTIDTSAIRERAATDFDIYALMLPRGRGFSHFVALVS